MKKILIIQGNPDAQHPHFCHALADAYASGAQGAGHQVSRIDVARLTFPWLRSKEEFEHSAAPEAIAEAQRLIREAEHIVIVYPLWLGGMPALLKAFWEQTFRPEFLFEAGDMRRKKLAGKTARIIITMGMPAWWYRLMYRAFSLRAIRVGIFHFVGIRPVRATLIGMVDEKKTPHDKWLERIRALGEKAG